MRRYLFLLLTITCAAPVVMGADGVFEFTPQMQQVISSYVATSKPLLPDHDEEEWGTIDCELSAVPGRMSLPREIVVDKPARRLVIVNAFGDTLGRYPVCASLKRGQKRAADDWRTPEGRFKIVGVYNSTDWTYKDTGDKCYGPFFISLFTPRFWGIGIHGTNSPGSIPGRRSHGCMRMHNPSIIKVKSLVNKDTRVTVLPDPPETVVD